VIENAETAVSLTYGGPSRPPASKPCERFNRDGSRCSNDTHHVDAWCRRPGCDGFRRAGTSSAPPPTPDTATGGLARARQADGDAAALPYFEPGTVHVTTAAIDSYRYHHGGSMESARGELRDMLEAFAPTAAVRSSQGYISLLRDGYKLTLNADLDVLTSYFTVHRERTWAQLQVGVTSRFPGGGSKGSPGEPLKKPAEFQSLTCDPQTVELKPRHLRAFAVRMDLQHLAEGELEIAFRRFIVEKFASQPGAVRRDNLVEFTEGDVRVIFSADQQRVMTVFWPRRADAED
jgi:hypothetical protein